MCIQASTHASIVSYVCPLGVCVCASFVSHLSPFPGSVSGRFLSSRPSQYHTSHVSHVSHLFHISFISLSLARSLSLSSFEASPPFLLRSHGDALLRGFMHFAIGLWQIATWEFLAAGLANAVARVSVNEVSCVIAAPRRCKRTSQAACTLYMLSASEPSSRLMVYRFGSQIFKSNDCA